MWRPRRLVNLIRPGAIGAVKTLSEVPRREAGLKGAPARAQDPPPPPVIRYACSEEIRDSPRRSLPFSERIPRTGRKGDAGAARHKGGSDLLPGRSENSPSPGVFSRDGRGIRDARPPPAARCRKKASGRAASSAIAAVTRSLCAAVLPDKPRLRVRQGRASRISRRIARFFYLPGRRFTSHRIYLACIPAVYRGRRKEITARVAE